MKKPIEHVALTANLRKQTVVRLCRDVIAWLRGKGLRVSATRELAGTLGVDLPDDVLEADLVVSLGGDGTLLKTARLVVDREIPILGVKIGTLGFLTETHQDDFQQSLGRVLKGDYTTESRLRLEVVLVRDGESCFGGSALNDVVVNASGARAIRIATSVDGRRVAEYLSDGLVIASPTGSTAYSLAAGGPVVHPSLATIIVTPICPHSLALRSMVLDPDRVFACELRDVGAGARMTLDGQENVPLDSGDRLEIRRSEKSSILVVSEAWDFFRVMREKLRWGGTDWEGKA